MKNPFDGTPDSNPSGYRGIPSPSRSFLGSNKLKILAGIVTFIIIVIVLSESVVIVQAGHRGVVLYVGAVSDILTLFLKKQLDGAWVPEPWATRLVKEGNGRIFLDERSIWPGGKFVTANIAVSTDYLKNNPDVISKLLAAHVNETLWINNHKDEAIKAFNAQTKKLTGKSIAEDELKQAFSRIDFTYDPLKLSLFQSANNAYDLGFLAKGKPHPDLSGIFDLTILDQVLKSKGLTQIEGERQLSLQSSSGGNLGAAE